MKLVYLALIALAQAAFGSGIPVVDVVHIAHTAGNQVMNYAKYLEETIKQTEISLHTLETYENTVLQVARFGNPSALRNLPVVSTIAELYSDGQRIQQDYQRWQSYLNPNRWQQDANSILSSYQYPNLQSFTSSSGYSIPQNEGLYQWDVSRWNVANAAQKELKYLEDKRQILEQKRDAAMQSLQYATTASEVAKYHASIDAVNGSLAEVAARSHEVISQVQIKQQQIQAGESVYRAQQVQQQQFAAYQSVDQDFQRLPADNFRQSATWGSN